MQVVKKQMANDPAGDEDQIDRALLAATAAGDVSAFERLYRRHYRKLHDFVARLLGGIEGAEEVASDAMRVLWRSADRFEGRAKVSTWLFGICYRLTLQAQRRSAKRWRDVSFEEDMHAPASAGDDVEAAFQRAEVARALIQLSPEHRAVMELTYYHGLTYGEIAEVVDCPVGTVKTRMMHARARMRRLIVAPDQSARKAR